MIKKIILDIETTGLDLKKNNKIIELCCLKIKNGKISKNIFHKYLNPKRKIDKESYLIHGLDNNFLKNKPLFSDIVEELLVFVKNSVIIIHNAKFDLSFLNFELKNLGYRNFDFYCNKIIDTLDIARKKFPGKKNSLDALCKRFNINIESRKLHSALIDCKLLFKVYYFLVRKDNNLIFKNLNYNKNKKLILSDNNIVLKANKNDLFNHYCFLKKLM